MSGNRTLEILVTAKDAASKVFDAVKASMAGVAAEAGKAGQAQEKMMTAVRARKELGIRGEKEIQAELRTSQAAYESLRKSGTATSQEMYRAKVALAQKTQELNRETSGWGTALGNVRMGWVALGAAVLAAGRSFQSFSDFNQRMTEVNTLVGAGTEAFRAMSDQVLRLSTEVPQSGTQLAAALYDIVSAGVDAGAALDVLEQSAQAAVAGVTDTKTAANAALSVINSYGKDISELGNVYDVLFQTVKIGVTTFPELAGSIGRVLPQAQAAGVSFEEVGAALAAMTKGGISTAESTTALAGAIDALASPTQQAKKEMEALGIEWNGLVPTLEQIAEKNLSIDQMRALIPDRNARIGILALTRDIDALKDSVAEMENSAGSMKAAYKLMEATPENRIKAMQSSVEALATKLGAALAPAIVAAAGAISGFLNGIMALPGPLQAVVMAIGAVVAGAALWHLGLGQVVLGLRGLVVALGSTAVGIKAVAAAKAAAAAAAAALGVSVGVATGGLSILAAAVIAAVAAFAKWAYGAVTKRRQLNELAEAAKQYAAAAGVERRSIEELTQMTEQQRDAYRETMAAQLEYLRIQAEIAKVKHGDGSQEYREAAAAVKDLEQHLTDVVEAQIRAGDSSAELEGHLARTRSQASMTAEEFEQFKQKLNELGQAYGDLGGRIANHYDQQAQHVQATVTNERDAAQAILEIHRQKTMDLIGLAEQELREKSAKVEAQSVAHGVVTQEIQRLHKEAYDQIIGHLKNWEQELGRALNEAERQHAAYAQKVIQYENEIQQIKERGAATIRELQRGLMSDEQAWNDRRKEGQELLKKAQQELARGTEEGAEAAKQYASEAERLFKSLAQGVKDGEREIISQSRGTQEAIKGVGQATEIAVKATDQLKTSAAGNAQAWSDVAAKIKSEMTSVKTTLDDMAKKRVAELEIDVNADEAFRVKAELEKNTSSTHTIYVKKVEQNALGGMVGVAGFAEGGQAGPFKRLGRAHIPGWGRKDDVPALLMRGEFVLRKEAVKKYGLGLLTALNGMRLSPELVPRFAEGGVVGAGKNGTERATGTNGGTGLFGAATASVYGAFDKTVRRLAGGGTASGADINAAISAVHQRYQALIEGAKKDGNLELARIAAQEQEEIRRIGEELKAKLAEIAERQKAEEERIRKERSEAQAEARAQSSALYNEYMEKIRAFRGAANFGFIQRIEERKYREKLREIPRVPDAKRDLWEIHKSAITAREQARAQAKEATKQAQAQAQQARMAALQKMEQQITQLKAEMQREIEELHKRAAGSSPTVSGSQGPRSYHTGFFADGGFVDMVRGAVRGKDSVRAMLAPGEYVVRESVVKALGARFFERLNEYGARAMEPLRFASGGLVPGASAVAGGPGDGGPGMRIDLNLNGQTFGLRSESETARALARELRRAKLSM